jgi:hypothetical protein
MAYLDVHGRSPGGFSLLALTFALACVVRAPGEGEESGDSTSASTGPTTSETTGPTTSETTGDAEFLCDVDSTYPDEGMFAVFPEGDVDEPCTLAGVVEADLALELTLQCPEFAGQTGGDFVVRIERGPRPQVLPPMGAALDVFATGFDPGYPYTSHAWLTLRWNDTLVYAVTQGEALLTELGDPTAYRPFEFTRDDVCPYVELNETGVVDATLLCQHGARSRLSVLVDGEQDLVMSEGETTTVVAGGVPYAIDLVAVRRLKDCNIDPPVEEFARYDFALAAQSE